MPVTAPTPRSGGAPSPAVSIAAISYTSEDPTCERSSYWTPRSTLSYRQFASPSKRRRTNESDRSSFHSVDRRSGILAYSQRSSFTGSQAIQGDTVESPLRTADFPSQGGFEPELPVSPSKSPKLTYDEIDYGTPRAWPQVSIQEACLMRYFIDELACWFE